MFNPFSFITTLFSDIDRRLLQLIGKKAAQDFISASEHLAESELGQFAIEVVQDLPAGALDSSTAWEAAAAKVTAQAILLGFSFSSREIGIILNLAQTAADRAKVKAS